MSSLSLQSRVLPLLVLVVLLGSSVAITPEALAGQRVVSPGKLKDDFDARLATSDNRLWLVNNGQDSSGRTRAEVLYFQNQKWRAIPGTPRSTTNTAIQIAVRDTKATRAQPCIGFDSLAKKPSVRCFQRGKWRSKRVGPTLSKSLLVGMRANGQTVTALFAHWVGGKTHIQVARLSGNRLIPFGPLLVAGGQVVAKLGQFTKEVTSNEIDVSIRGANDGSRSIATLHQNEWTHSSPLPTREGGSDLSGPVRTADSLYVPLVQNFLESETPERLWAMSVFRDVEDQWSEVGGEPVSREKGHAQGGISPVGNRIWTTWGELSPSLNAGAFFPTINFAARVNPTGDGYDKMIRLWKGRTIAPFTSQAIQFKGKVVFLYARQFKRKGGMFTTVDFSQD